jgi:hypothetical protein
MTALTHSSDEFSIEFPSEQWLWELPKESTNCCSHSMNTAALQTGILWIWDEKVPKFVNILCQTIFVYF